MKKVYLIFLFCIFYSINAQESKTTFIDLFEKSLQQTPAVNDSLICTNLSSQLALDLLLTEVSHL